MRALDRDLFTESLQGSGALCTYPGPYVLNGYHRPLITEVWAEAAPVLGGYGDVV